MPLHPPLPLFPNIGPEVIGSSVGLVLTTRFSSFTSPAIFGERCGVFFAGESGYVLDRVE